MFQNVVIINYCNVWTQIDQKLLWHLYLVSSKNVAIFALFLLCVLIFELNICNLSINKKILWNFKACLFKLTPFQRMEGGQHVIRHFHSCLGLALMVIPLSILGTEKTFFPGFFNPKWHKLPPRRTPVLKPSSNYTIRVVWIIEPATNYK